MCHTHVNIKFKLSGTVCMACMAQIMDVCTYVCMYGCMYACMHVWYRLLGLCILLVVWFMPWKWPTYLLNCYNIISYRMKDCEGMMNTQLLTHLCCSYCHTSKHVYFGKLAIQGCTSTCNLLVCLYSSFCLRPVRRVFHLAWLSKQLTYRWLVELSIDLSILFCDMWSSKEP